MRACDVDIDVLRDKLTSYLDNELSGLVLDTHGDAQPTAGLPARDPPRSGACAVVGP